MAVYVDGVVDYGDAVRLRLGHSRWCHMTADTEAELHEMADLIGLRRSWFQNKDGITWHYDVTPNKRALAVRNGAEVVDFRRMGQIISNRRQERNRGA